MDFIQLALEDIDGEAAEAVSEVFDRFGYGGAVIEAMPPNFDRVTIRTIIPATDEDKVQEMEIVLALMRRALPYGLPEVSKTLVGEQDWAESWKENFHVIHIGPRVVVQPSWRNYQPQPKEIVIKLDPGLAFGTGLHPTTRLCLELLQAMPLADVAMFDVGTGSGILSIAACQLGAQPIRAVDVDDVAVRVARENFERNGLADIQTAVGSAESHGGRTWPLVAANILAHILIEIMADLKSALAPDGQLILSGIIAEQIAVMKNALTEHQLRIVQEQFDGDWVAFVVEHTPDS